MDNLYEKLSTERKKLQEHGDMPDFWSTGSWQLFKAKYLYEAKTPKEQYQRIARTLAKYIGDTYPEWWPTEYPTGYTWEDAFFDQMWLGNLSGSTPVISNTGTDRGMSVSCAGSVIANNINDIYDGKREVAVLTKHGFGTASYLGDIQPRGSKTDKGLVSVGVLPILKGFVDDMQYVAQGSSRRGAWAGYLPIEHGDFYEVVSYLEEAPDGLNIGWNVSDEFVNKLEAGDTESNAKFQAALNVKMKTGKGYFVFIDKANRQRPQTYIDNGLKVVSSQLCVAPETLVLTSQGHKVIESLAGAVTSVWNGIEWSDVEIIKTGVDQPLITVTTQAGFTVDCTPYHRFYVMQNNHRQGRIIKKMASELIAGDKLIKFELPVIHGKKVLDKAYQNGFYSGDGCLVEGRKRVYLYGEKRSLRHLFTGTTVETVQEDQNREYFYVAGLEDKFFIPNSDYSVKSRVDWLAGLLDSDGCVTTNGKSQSLQVASVETGFLESLQLMLQTLGIQSKVVHQRDAGIFKLPANDGTGGLRDFQCKKVVRLLINGVGVRKLLHLGLVCHRLLISQHIPNRDARGFVKIKSVENKGRISDTYCFKENKRGMGVFNGILTGQCSEILLHSSNDLTYTCVLSSMNLVHWDRIKTSKAVFIATVFLDCVAEDFITKAKGVKGLEKAVKSTELGRPLGLGACGLHTYFQANKVPFESFEAHMLNNEMFKHIHDQSLEASQWMAETLGEPEWCVGYGVRNTHRTAVAPTKSSALLMAGVSEGINPDFAMTFTQLTPAGEIERANPILLKLMKEKGVSDKKHMQELVDAQGSVQNVDWLTNEEKEVFKTAFEIDQKAILRLAAGRQRYICQGQSLNLFFSADEDEEYIAEVHSEAFKNENILGLYYCYSKAGVTASKGECTACM